MQDLNSRRFVQFYLDIWHFHGLDISVWQHIIDDQPLELNLSQQGIFGDLDRHARAWLQSEKFSNLSISRSSLRPWSMLDVDNMPRHLNNRSAMLRVGVILSQNIPQSGPPTCPLIDATQTKKDKWITNSSQNCRVSKINHLYDIHVIIVNLLLSISFPAKYREYIIHLSGWTPGWTPFHARLDISPTGLDTNKFYGRPSLGTKLELIYTCDIPNKFSYIFL